MQVLLPRGLAVDKLMGKMALDKKNVGGAIRCTIITGIGSSINEPLPVSRPLIESVLCDSLAASETSPEWVPLQGLAATASVIPAVSAVSAEVAAEAAEGTTI